jgi:hypothetical protein
MAITNAFCNSMKQELLVGQHNFTTTTGNVFKIALYTSAATLDATTTIYSATNEVVGTGYTAAGITLANVTPVLSAGVAYTDFSVDPLWTNSTITARGALIYNSTNGNRACASLDFGADKISSAGDFTVVFPAAASGTAIIRIT